MADPAHNAIIHSDAVWIKAKRGAAGFQLPNYLPSTTSSTMKIAGIIPNTIRQSEPATKISYTILRFEPTMDRRTRCKIISLTNRTPGKTASVTLS